MKLLLLAMPTNQYVAQLKYDINDDEPVGFYQFWAKDLPKQIEIIYNENPFDKIIVCGPASYIDHVCDRIKLSKQTMYNFNFEIEKVEM